MSNTQLKITQGEWKADIGCYPIADTGDYTSYCSLVTDNLQIAGFNCDCCGISIEEAEANVRLTAAAPELYNALYMFTQAIPFVDGVMTICGDALHPVHREFLKQYMEDAQKALKKARGEV